MGTFVTNQRHSDESFIRSLNRYTPITKAEEYALIAQAQDGDVTAKHRLIDQHNRQVLKIARRYVGRGLSLWDLFSEGRIGLLKAVEKFETERGFRLSTYAGHWIRQAVNRAIQNQGRTIRIPVHAQEFYGKITRAVRELKRYNESDEPPSDKAIAEWMYRYYGTPDEDDGCHRKVVEKIRKMRNSRAFLGTVSLETPVDDGEHTQLKELIPEEIVPDGLEALLDNRHRDTIGSAIDKLRSKEKYVIHFRFFLEWTLEQVAATMINRHTERHITRERVRQIEEVALKKLHLILQKDHLQRTYESH